MPLWKAVETETNLETIWLDDLIAEVSPIVSNFFRTIFNTPEVNVESNSSENIKTVCLWF